GEFRRARTPLRGGAAGILGPLLDPLAVNGDPGTTEAIPALSRPRDVPAERLERRAALLSILEHRGAAWPATRSLGLLRDQAVALTGAAGGASRSFALDGEPGRL